MNVFEKLCEARAELKSMGIKMSGSNSYAGYDYFELADFMPKITELEKKYKILSVVKFGLDMATLTVYNVDLPEEKIEFTSPMSSAELKGCHAVQNLGAVETYIRRYLYLIAYEIVESEALDKTQGKPSETKGEEEKKEESKNTSNSTMTLERAKNLCFKNGKNANVVFDKLSDETLEWAVQNLSGAYAEGAKLVLESRKQPAKPEQRRIIEIDDNELPF